MAFSLGFCSLVAVGVQVFCQIRSDSLSSLTLSVLFLKSLSCRWKSSRQVVGRGVWEGHLAGHVWWLKRIWHKQTKPSTKSKWHLQQSGQPILAEDGQELFLMLGGFCSGPFVHHARILRFWRSISKSMLSVPSMSYRPVRCNIVQLFLTHLLGRLCDVPPIDASVLFQECIDGFTRNWETRVFWFNGEFLCLSFSTKKFTMFTPSNSGPACPGPCISCCWAKVRNRKQGSCLNRGQHISKCNYVDNKDLDISEQC